MKKEGVSLALIFWGAIFSTASCQTLVNKNIFFGGVSRAFLANQMDDFFGDVCSSICEKKGVDRTRIKDDWE